MKPHACIDIRKERCPMTYVRVKLAMENLAPGELLEVILVGAEPIRNVPQSAVEDGHEVVSLDALPDGASRLLLRLGGGPKR